MRKVLFGLIPLVAAAVAGWLVVLDRQGRLVWDHWDEAKRGVLYRSGQLTGDQLTQAVKRHNIRTVINLQLPGAETGSRARPGRPPRRRFREPADARRRIRRRVAIPRDPQDHRRSPSSVPCWSTVPGGPAGPGPPWPCIVSNATAGRSTTSRSRCAGKPIGTAGCRVTSMPWRRTNRRPVRAAGDGGRPQPSTWNRSRLPRRDDEGVDRETSTTEPASSRRRTSFETRR